MKMGNSGDAPGVTGQGAYAETARVIIDKVCDNRSDDLLVAGEECVAEVSGEAPPSTFSGFRPELDTKLG